MGILNLSDDEKVLAARARDYISRALDRGIPTFTDFLSERERAVVLDVSSSLSAMDNTVVFGGFADAERTVVGFFPDYFLFSEKDELYREFPICLLEIECSGFKEHSHRDFLGSVLGLGLDRSVVGDIIVGDKGYSANIFVLSRICDFIADNLKLVGRDGVTVRKADLSELSSVRREFELIKGTCASMRSDALVSEILNLSREKAQKLFTEGYVSINHETVENRSKIITVGDIIAIRGHGKFRISSIGDLNRKGRTRFEVQKYV